MVDSAWLEQRLKDKQLVLVDMTEDDLQYTRFHLPGAVRLAYHELLSSRGPGKPAARLDEKQFAALLGRLGIARDTHVVIYDDVGGLNAGRLFLELEHIRHPAVSVLDGGLVQWVLDGRRVENIARVPLPVVYKAGQERRDNLATLAEVRIASKEATPVLLDVRSRDEYVGNAKEARSGHVPGARWWPWEQAIAMDNGQTYLSLRSLGFENIRVHTGSMLEYLQDSTAPLKLGPTP